jgi:hypothetical protein
MIPPFTSSLILDDIETFEVLSRSPNGSAVFFNLYFKKQATDLNTMIIDLENELKEQIEKSLKQDKEREVKIKKEEEEEERLRKIVEERRKQRREERKKL